MAEPNVTDLSWLKAQLALPGRSQGELARRLGVNASAVNRLVNGKRELKAREIPIVEAYLAETSADRPSGAQIPLKKARDTEILNPLKPHNALVGFTDMYSAIERADDRELIMHIDAYLGACISHYIKRWLDRKSAEEVAATNFFLFESPLTNLGILVEIAASYEELPLNTLADFRRIAATRERFRRDPTLASFDAPEIKDVWEGSWVSHLGLDGHASFGESLRTAIMYSININSNYLLLEFDAADRVVSNLHQFADAQRRKREERQ